MLDTVLHLFKLEFLNFGSDSQNKIFWNTSFAIENLCC